MKFNKLFIPKEKAALTGLKAINLTTKPLGRFVALVGKNGAGKTRILDLVEDYLSIIKPNQITEDHINYSDDNFSEYGALAVGTLIR